MSHSDQLPKIGFAAYSGTGKTTLLKKIIPELSKRHFRVAVVKHAHHTFEIDHEGKDSYELRKAGADQLLIGSKQRWAHINEKPSPDLGLTDYLSLLQADSLDVILVEGFKPEKIPKIELFRPSLGHKPFYPEDDSIVAIATDGELPVSSALPKLDINNPINVCEFIIDYLKL